MGEVSLGCSEQLAAVLKNVDLPTTKRKAGIVTGKGDVEHSLFEEAVGGYDQGCCAKKGNNKLNMRILHNELGEVNIG